MLAGCQASEARSPAPPAGVTDAPRPAQVATPSAAALPVAKPGGGAAEAGFAPSSASPAAIASAVAQAFVLRSSAFASGGALPSTASCDGAGASPPLEWSGAPAGTRAYALLVEDTDASLTEWVAYNMPINVSGLDAGVAARPLLSNGAQQGTNSHGTIGYDPVCPDHGDPPHHYAFQLFAVGDYITMQTGAPASDVKAALQGHTIASAQLMATYGR